jgi:hypothetical protein
MHHTHRKHRKHRKDRVHRRHPPARVALVLAAAGLWLPGCAARQPTTTTILHALQRHGVDSRLALCIAQTAATRLDGAARRALVTDPGVLPPAGDQQVTGIARQCAADVVGVPSTTPPATSR